MDGKILYQLTMRCDKKRCEFAFSLAEIKRVDVGYIYLEDRKVARKNLASIAPQYGLDKILLTAFFMQKEAVLVMARQMCMYLYRNNSTFFPLAQEEWERMRIPKYDTCWFSEKGKIRLWEREFMQQLWEPIHDGKQEAL